MVKNVLLISNIDQSHCVVQQCETYVVLTWYQYKWAKIAEEKAKSKSCNKKAYKHKKVSKVIIVIIVYCKKC